MRWVNYRSTIDGREHAAVANDTTLVAAEQSLLELLQSGQALGLHAAHAARDPFETLPLDEADLLAPVPRPPSVRDFMAFENHVVTSYAALGTRVSPVWYDQPVFYFTNPAAILGPHDDVPLAPGTQQYDYELEVGAVIGRAGADIAPEDAERNIGGYLLFCDWSSRDLQATEMTVGLGPAKGKDTATTLGPFLVTPEELEPFRSGKGFDLTMTASVNGRTYSTGNWNDLYWSFPQMLAYASRGTELRPGDVIGSGTVGTGCILELSRVHGHDAYPWLAAGDEVHLEIAGLGSITTRISPATREPIPLV
jgi:2-keto-4-pentenoate hydratase/2-oxohepta-3-ene-1,7-dioic acid hydratase in catechol pathway